jgi:two-component system sensor histidine kinase UhpB
VIRGPPLNHKRELDQPLQRGAVQEVQQLAAEIHDGIGQELAGISLLLAALRRLPQTQDPEVQKPLEHISGLVVQAIVNCRQISEGFGGFGLRQQGLTAALLHFASQFDDEAMRVEFHGREIPLHWLDDATAYYLFGIGREAIFNSFRHSRAKAIKVTCDHDDNTVRLSVEDDGIGFPEPLNNGHGIGRSIMEFRAQSIGAELLFTAVPSGGLRVDCLLSCLKAGSGEPTGKPSDDEQGLDQIVGK